MRSFPWATAISIWQKTSNLQSFDAYLCACEAAESLDPPDNMVTAIQQLKDLYDLYLMEELL